MAILDLEAVVTKSKESDGFLSEKKETCSMSVIGKIKPSEKEAFVKLLGRQSESSKIREMILEFIRTGGDQ